MPKVLRGFTDYLNSSKFYRLVIIFFIIEAAWIAVSAAYPQAFDENFHFGLIRVYSHYWLPFLTKQPPNANAYGAVARNPSYLYEYLMSFPYRLIALVVHRQLTQVIILRFINIGLMTGALVLFKRVLVRVGTSRALSNLLLALFVLIPIVPQLAAQVNYDNLLILLTAAMVLVAFRLVDQIRQRRLSVIDLSLWISLCTFTSLVKYAFLPIFAGMLLFLAVLIYRTNRSARLSLKRQITGSWHVSKVWLRAAVIGLLILSIGMFMQMDGVNLVLYHKLQPDCSQVLSVKDCLAYSPWAYNYHNHIEVIKKAASIHYANPLEYIGEWLYWMWYRLFFAVNGLNSHFRNYPPLPLPSTATLLAVLAGLAALIKWWRKIFANNLYLVMLFVIAACYVVALMGQGYVTYKYTDVLENMNGRYLLPILLPSAVIFGQAISYGLRRFNVRKTILAMLVLLLFLEGGGALTFIIRSNSTWYTPNKTIIKANNTIRKVIKPIVLNNKKHIGKEPWFIVN